MIVKLFYLDTIYRRHKQYKYKKLPSKVVGICYFLIINFYFSCNGAVFFSKNFDCTVKTGLIRGPIVRVVERRLLFSLHRD